MSLIGSTGSVSNVVNEYVANNLLGDQLLSGSAVWISDLDFAVSDCVFVVNNQLYTAAADTVSLTAADGSNPRIDVIAANIDGTIDIVTGTAAAAPAKPEIDPDTQVEITFAYVAAGATTPSNVSNTDVYLEDAQWTTTEVGNVTSDSTDDPYAGTKSIDFALADNGDYITLTTGTAIDPTSVDTLMFYIKNVNYGTKTNVRLRFAFYNSTTRVSNWIDLVHGAYGFDGNNVADYQLIQIPIGNFVPNGTWITTLRIQVAENTADTISCYIDNIKLQTGVTSVDYSQYAKKNEHNVWTKAQGSGITVLTDAATIAWDASQGNVYQVTLGGNRTMAAPTNLKPGYTYILIVIQDGTGSRTITWNAVFDWAGGTAPTLTTTASAFDVITFVARANGNMVGAVGVANPS